MAAPVEAVGGKQSDGGPWPDDVDEIAEGDTLTREMFVGFKVVERDVRITSVTHVGDGFSVGYEEVRNGV